MATIKARRQANGAIRYTAIVRKRVGQDNRPSGSEDVYGVLGEASGSRAGKSRCDGSEKIGVVLRAAKSVKELTVRPEIVQQARVA